MHKELTDRVRVFTIVAVLVIHSTARWEKYFLNNFSIYELSSYFSISFFAVLVNQLARFAVPLFVILSGYGLMQSSRVADSEPGQNLFKSVLVFYQKRLKYVGLPFLIWTIFFLIYKLYVQNAHLTTEMSTQQT